MNEIAKMKGLGFLGLTRADQSSGNNKKMQHRTLIATHRNKSIGIILYMIGEIRDNNNKKYLEVKPHDYCKRAFISMLNSSTVFSMLMFIFSKGYSKSSCLIPVQPCFLLYHIQT
jgi:hypothetical protein